jgi:hypothetical protein
MAEPSIRKEWRDWNPSAAVQGEGDGEGGQVEDYKDDLGGEYILSPGCQVIQHRINVDMSSRITAARQS